MDPIPESAIRYTLHLPSSSLQFCFVPLENNTVSLDGAGPMVIPIDLIDNEHQLLERFSPELILLGIESDLHQDLVSDFIQELKTYTSSRSSEEHKVRAFNLRVLINYFDGDEDDVLDSVESRLSAEYEERNYGLVPAAIESMRSMLVPVKFEQEKEDKVCRVCCEELVDIASALPCGHVFHGKCVRKWMVISHFRPICRYEMPAHLGSTETHVH